MAEPGLIPVPPPVVQHDGVVVISGEALSVLYRAVLSLAIRHRRDGVASPPLLHQARAALYRAMSPQRHKVRATTNPPATLRLP